MFTKNDCRLIHGDCLVELKTLPENSIELILTDPPYEIGFMGNKWDNTGIVYNVDMWKECLRVLKPGGHLLSFGGTRTYHRMVVAIEDAGFEIRDMIEWVYGSGMSKCNVWGYGKKRTSKSLNTENNLMVDNGWAGWGKGGIKPSHEPICMSRKPIERGLTVAENCLKWGVGAINIDISRVGTEDTRAKTGGAISGSGWGTRGGVIAGSELGRFPANLIWSHHPDCIETDEVEVVKGQQGGNMTKTFGGSVAISGGEGSGGKMKVSDSFVKKWICHPDCPTKCFPETKSGKMGKQHTRHTDGSPNGIYGNFDINHELGETYGDSGNASRFFKSIIYQAKSSKSERNKGCGGLGDKDRIDYGGLHSERGLIENNRNPENRLPNKNNHPTVKPVELLKYLINMFSREGQTVLDVFAGSGSTGVASLLLKRNFIGIELSGEYIPIIEARLKWAERQVGGKLL